MLLYIPSACPPGGPGGLAYRVNGSTPPKWAKTRILVGGVHQSDIPGFSNYVFIACKAMLTGEEYRAKSTCARDMLEVMNQLETRSVPRKAYKSCR